MSRKPLKKQFQHEVAQRQVPDTVPDARAEAGADTRAEPEQGSKQEPDHRPRVRFFAMDEARFGLKTWFRRRWCPLGHRPPWVFQDKYEWLWLYAAVEPATGESFCLYLPHLDGLCFEVFLRQLRRAYPDDRLVLVLDRAGAHRSGQVAWPEQVEPLWLPACSPELNPAERWFRELREALSNRVFASVEELEESLREALIPYWVDERKLARLVGYGWWVEATGSILTP